MGNGMFPSWHLTQPTIVLCRGVEAQDSDTISSTTVSSALQSLDDPQATEVARLHALTTLRKATQAADSPHAEACLQAGVVNVLRTALDSWPESCQVEAAWCLSNLAAGSNSATEAVAVVLPHLVPLLGAPSPLLVEHAAWVVGNLATSRVSRQRLVDSGAVPPLCSAVLAGVQADVARASAAAAGGVPAQQSQQEATLHQQRVSTAKVACWACTNLLRGDTPALPLLQAGGAAALQTLFCVLAPTAAAPGQQASSQATAAAALLDKELVTELAWLAAYSAAREDEAVSALVEVAALGGGVALLSAGHPPATLPALRLLGNMAAMGVPAWNEALTGSATLLHCLHTMVSSGSVASLSPEAAERARVQALEAMWVLSQLALTHAAVLVKQSFLPAVVAQLHGTWAMRSQCLYALYNILVHGATAPQAQDTAAMASHASGPAPLSVPPSQPAGGSGQSHSGMSASSAAAPSHPGPHIAQGSAPPFLSAVLQFDAVLPAFVECLRKPDLNLVHMGLSVLDMSLRWGGSAGRSAVEAAGGGDALEHVALHGPGDTLSVEASGLTAAAEKLSDWASDLFDEFLQDAAEDEGTLQLPAGQQTLLGSWGNNSGSPSRVPKAANMPAWAAALK